MNSGEITQVTWVEAFAKIMPIAAYLLLAYIAPMTIEAVFRLGKGSNQGFVLLSSVFLVFILGWMGGFNTETRGFGRLGFLFVMAALLREGSMMSPSVAEIVCVQVRL